LTDLITAIDLAKGEKARITAIKANDFTCRLLTLGILPDKTCEIAGISPFGGAKILSLDHHLVALRDEELRSIMIEKIKPADHA
jgi:Fe2+ transport system protein FeoA